MVERNELIRLVTSAQAGDKEATAALYDHFHEDTYFFVKSMVIDPELAADLTQDTFVEMLNKISTLQEPAAFVGWIRQIAYHKSVNYFKKSKAITVDEDEDGYSVFDTLEENRAEFIPDAALDQEDFKATILSMLLELPETQRAALVLHYYEEHSVKAIAQIQGVSEGTVKSRLNYGRNALKQAVESYEKKNGIKLHCVGVIPLLLWLFRQGVLVRNTTVSGTAAAATATAGTKAVTAAKTGLFTKLIAGGLAIAAVSGGIFAISKAAKPKDTESTIQTTEAEETEESEQVQTDPMMPQPEGNYESLYLYVDYADAPVYTKDGHIFYYGQNGPVQLTQQPYTVNEQGFFQYRYCIKFSTDDRYVYYPDNIVVSQTEVMEGDSISIREDISFDLYFRDLQDLNSRPVKIGENIQEYQISPDGLRIAYPDYEKNGYTVCDLSSSGIVQTYFIESGLQLYGIPYYWNDDLTCFVYVKPADMNDIDFTQQLFVWENGTSSLICEPLLRLEPVWSDSYGITGFYYIDFSNNLYLYDLSIRENTWCSDQVAYITADWSTENGIYIVNFKDEKSNFMQQEFYKDLVDFDTGETELILRNDVLNDEHILLAEYADYYLYRNGEKILVAEDVYSYTKEQFITIIGQFHPENVEKVKVSQYGVEGAQKEALRRLTDSFRWTIHTKTDTLVLDISPRTGIRYDMLMDCVLYEEYSPEQGESYYRIPVVNGMFGTAEQYDPATSLPVIGEASPDHSIYSIANVKLGGFDLYIDDNLIQHVIAPNVELYDGGFLCTTDFDKDTGLGTVCVIYKDHTTVIAEKVYVSSCLIANETLYYMVADTPGSQTGDLYLYRDGNSSLLDSNIQLEGYLIY